MVTLHWPSFPPILVADWRLEVGDSRDSRELAEVGLSEAEQLRRSGLAAEVAPSSGTGAGQRWRPVLSSSSPGSATHLSKGPDNSGPFSGAVFSLGEVEELYLMSFKVPSNWSGSCLLLRTRVPATLLRWRLVLRVSLTAECRAAQRAGGTGPVARKKDSSVENREVGLLDISAPSHLVLSVPCGSCMS